MNEVNTGIFYGVGVGPGDPDLMTLRALKLIRQADCLAVPCSEQGRDSLALSIVQSQLSEVEWQQKEMIDLVFPMTHNRTLLQQSHQVAANQVQAYLRAGKSVVFITLGDPGLYSTFQYVAKLVQATGLRTELVPGVPAFCAVAARAGVSLTEKGQRLALLAVPGNAADLLPLLLQFDTLVLMKAGQKMATIRDALDLATAADALAAETTGLAGKSGSRVQYNAIAVDRCGLPGEQVASINQDSSFSYFTTVIIKKEEV